MEDNVDYDVIKDLGIGADFINNSIVSNRRTLIHCYKGQSRSVILVMAYMVKYKSMTV